MKKKVFFWLAVIFVVIVGGLVGWWLISRNNSTSQTSPTPNAKLSQQELEKYLLEKRLELKKYFVFNLGELKTLSQANTQTKNIRITNSNLGSDLTKLTNLAFKYLEKKGYEMRGVTVGKRRVTFLEDGDNDTVSYDEEWEEANLDQKITDGNLYIVFEKEKNYDWPNAWFQVWNYTNSNKKDLVWTSDFQLRVKNPATTICESKEKALEIIKTDPALQGRI